MSEWEISDELYDSEFIISLTIDLTQAFDKVDRNNIGINAGTIHFVVNINFIVYLLTNSELIIKINEPKSVCGANP